MTYLKINKPSLDYHHFSDFHVFTMNNFIRNVMKNGKYKKAVKLVRLGLIFGLKTLRHKLRLKDENNVRRSYRYLRQTELTPNTKKALATKLQEIENYKIFLSKDKRGQSLVNNYTDTILYGYPLMYYQKFYEKTYGSSVSFLNIFNTSYKEEIVKPLVSSQFKEHQETKYNIEASTGTFHSLNLDQNPALNRYNYQYNKFESRKFKKLYTKRPHTHYYGSRNLTSFDMVIQVYSMLTGVWYMRKAKVSGRTILIPSPLRPYRRIITVTKMLMRGIKIRRKQERFDKRAMIQSIGREFYFLLLYNGFQYGQTSIDNSEVWGQKMASHKELVANLKNIKHLKYF